MSMYYGVITILGAVTAIWSGIWFVTEAIASETTGTADTWLCSPKHGSVSLGLVVAFGSAIAGLTWFLRGLSGWVSGDESNTKKEIDLRHAPVRWIGQGVYLSFFLFAFFMLISVDSPASIITLGIVFGVALSALQSSNESGDPGEVNQNGHFLSSLTSDAWLLATGIFALLVVSIIFHINEFVGIPGFSFHLLLWSGIIYLVYHLLIAGRTAFSGAFNFGRWDQWWHEYLTQLFEVLLVFFVHFFVLFVYAKFDGAASNCPMPQNAL